MTRMISTFIQSILFFTLLQFAVTGVLAETASSSDRRIVVCPFDASHTNESDLQILARTLSDLVAIQLDQADGIQIVDRFRIDRIFAENGLSESGLVKRDANAALIARILHANIAVSGSVIEFKKQCYAIVRVFQPITGVLIAMKKVPIQRSQLDTSIREISQFISQSPIFAPNEHKDRYIAFVPNASMDATVLQMTGETELLVAALQTRYVGSKQIGVLVRSGVSSLLMEHYLRFATQAQINQCLLDAKHASTIIGVDLIYQGETDCRVNTETAIIGFGNIYHTLKFKKHNLIEQYCAWMDDWLQINTLEISNAQRAQAQRYYEAAMKQGGFYYKQYDNALALWKDKGTIHLGYAWRFRKQEAGQAEIINLFEKALHLDPHLYEAIPPLTYTFLYKIPQDNGRGRALLRKLISGPAGADLKRIAIEIDRRSKLCPSDFNTFSNQGKALFDTVVEMKYINREGFPSQKRWDYHRLHSQLELPRTYSRYREPVFWLLKEARKNLFFNDCSSTSTEAIRHYKLGLEAGGLQFKRGVIRYHCPVNLTEYIANFDTIEPSIVSIEKRDDNASKRVEMLHTAINYFSLALFVDPAFTEAKLMLAHCLRDSLIGQTDKSCRLARSVYDNAHFPFFKAVAATMKCQSDSMAYAPEPAPEDDRHRATPEAKNSKTVANKQCVATPVLSSQNDLIPGDAGRHQKTDLQDILKRFKSAMKCDTALPASAAKIDVGLVDSQLLAGSKRNDGTISTKTISANKIYSFNRESYLGTSVAISDNFAVASAPLGPVDKYKQLRYGAVFVLDISESKIDGVIKLTMNRREHESNTDHPQLGRAVDASDDKIIAGAPYAQYKGPVKPEDFAGISFESPIDLPKLIDKLFRLGYIDAHKIVTDKFEPDHTKDFAYDFPECSAKDCHRIIKILKSSRFKKQAGCAYIFSKKSGAWQTEAIISALDAEPDNHFGINVGICGEHAVVGSLNGVYFFRYLNNQWTQSAKFTGCQGTTLDISGAYAICGAKDVAIIYFWDGHQWIEQTRIHDPMADSCKCFPSAVAIDKDLAIAVNPYRKIHFGENSTGDHIGAAYIFKRSGMDWRFWRQLPYSPYRNGNQFGQTVALGWPYILITARERVDSTDQSVVYLYEIQDETIIEHGSLYSSSTPTYDRFGYALSIMNDKFFIGAMNTDSIGQNSHSVHKSGAAYLLEWH